MDERVRVSILLDLYGELLTDKQKDIMNLYFNDDLSLSEISELNCTSRQAIYDLIKRCQKLLFDYDNKLKLTEKEEQSINRKNNIVDNLDKLQNIIDNKEVLEIIENIKKEVLDI